ncbi:MAG: hypothetical protein CMG25_00715 [Candidatus Marinimicrobia bacterium]|nr:hypothetical protein [Candidatus Neomarinimicrobiota bacterium]|tara:strand:+ start:827 stop:1498 length:672 start_codon:yes stop_codon:yes gene_type:complete
MKKMLILVLTLSLPFAFDAGTKSVGGGVNFVSNITTQTYTTGFAYDVITYTSEIEMESTSTDFMIMPSGSYFVIDNLAIGGNLSMTMSTLETTTTATTEACIAGIGCETTTTEETYSSADDTNFENPMGFGFMAAYYMNDSYYGHFGFQEPNNTVDDNEYLEFGAGYLYKLTDSIFIDTKVSYRHMLGEGSADLSMMDEGTEVSGFEETNIKLYGTVGISVFF